ncbi:MAG: histidine phosphatase family protein [Saprospiraceae bacterium]|nr:histidine phosphatase family protein [Saprospiraceae bacterium]
MKEIFILRHGETECNRNRIVQGSGVDSELNETGIVQSKKFFSKYKSIPFDLHIHSNLIRTKQTISLFLNPSIPCLVDDRIREISWGEHEGKGDEPELMQKYYRVIRSWQGGIYTDKALDGESAIDLSNRLNPFIKDLKNLTFSKALICTHGRTLRAMICIFKNWPLSRMEEIEHTNTGLYHLILDENDWKIIIENDLAHLE